MFFNALVLWYKYFVINSRIYEFNDLFDESVLVIKPPAFYKNKLLILCDGTLGPTASLIRYNLSLIQISMLL